MPSRRIRVARVGAPHGVRGEVRLRVYADDPFVLESLGPIEDADGRHLRLLSLRPGKGHAIARFAEIEDRAAAERLTNIDLYVDRDRLPPLEVGRVYHADLIGLRAETANGGTLGEVAAVRNFGAGDILEIAVPGREQTVMVPFVDRFVPEIDLAGGRVVVEPPEGALDDTPPLKRGV